MLLALHLMVGHHGAGRGLAHPARAAGGAGDRCRWPICCWRRWSPGRRIPASPGAVRRRAGRQRRGGAGGGTRHGARRQSRQRAEPAAGSRRRPRGRGAAAGAGGQPRQPAGRLRRSACAAAAGGRMAAGAGCGAGALRRQCASRLQPGDRRCWRCRCCPALARLLRRLLPDRAASDPAAPRYLDAAALRTPSVALANAAREVLRIADRLEAMLRGLGRGLPRRRPRCRPRRRPTG